MRRGFAMFFFTALVVLPHTAAAQLFKFQCVAPTKAAHVFEINAKGQTVRHWAKPFPDVTNGPYGPYEARITSEQIVWRVATTKGKGPVAGLVGIDVA